MFKYLNTFEILLLKLTTVDFIAMITTIVDAIAGLFWLDARTAIATLNFVWIASIVSARDLIRPIGTIPNTIAVAVPGDAHCLHGRGNTHIALRSLSTAHMILATVDLVTIELVKVVQGTIDDTIASCLLIETKFVCSVGTHELR